MSLTVSEDGGIIADGPEAVNVLRMLTIRRGISLEVKTGMKLTRARTCSAIATDILRSEGIIGANKRPNKPAVYRLFNDYLVSLGMPDSPL